MLKNNGFTFFTKPQAGLSSYCLMNIKDYHKKEKFGKKIIYFIDPSVYDLVENEEYSKIDLLHDLAKGKLQQNEFISIDYPCDMNERYSRLFIEKSIENNLKYKDNMNYICTIQSKFMDFEDFKNQFEFLESKIDFSKKIIGIGNLCRIMYPCKFTDEVFRFLSEKQKEHDYFYHIYGLSMRLVRKYLPKLLFCSSDSTKWTRAVTNELKSLYGLNCNSKTMDLYFLEYMKTLRSFLSNISY